MTEDRNSCGALRRNGEPDARRNIAGRRTGRAALKWLSVGLFCLFAAAPPGVAGETPPIDAWLEAALARETTTAGEREALNRAHDMWNAEMNRAYTALTERLDKKRRALLRRAQQKWLEFRDAEFRALAQLVAAKEGTMWQRAATERAMELVRQRALWLGEYERTLEE